MKTTRLGFLQIGDTFYFKGEKYKVNSLGDRPFNNVNCTNLVTQKRKRFDVDSDVGIAESEGKE
jgi:hypothetical protein